MIDPVVRGTLEAIFRAALDAVAPDRLVGSALEGAVSGSETIPEAIAHARRIFLLAAGKAAWPMAAVTVRKLERRLAGSLVVVPHGWPHEARAGSGGALRVIEASHPIPDESSQLAALAALDLAGGAGAGDLLLIALSGGASALLAAPSEGIELDDKIETTRMLLQAGASIREINVVRKHISAIKGGRLAQAARGARIVNLVLSDVPGNDLATIGSGVSVPDPSNFEDARMVLKRLQLWGRVPERVRSYLDLGASGRIEESPKPRDPAFVNLTNVIIGDNETALAGAASAAQEFDFSVERWRRLKGEADVLGRNLGAHLSAITAKRVCVIAGGEPVVTVRGRGRGGRAQHLALSLAIELNRAAKDRRIAALIAGTDGVDGPTDAAGGFIWQHTVSRALAAGLDPESALARNDAYSLFAAAGDLLKTGPTGTNVSDIFIGLINY